MCILTFFKQDLKEGASVDISAEPSILPVDPVIEVSFDGDMRGFFNIAARNMVFFTGETDTPPAFRGAGSESVRMNDDATLRRSRRTTIALFEAISVS